MLGGTGWSGRRGGSGGGSSGMLLGKKSRMGLTDGRRFNLTGFWGSDTLVALSEIVNATAGAV